MSIDRNEVRTENMPPSEHRDDRHEKKSLWVKIGIGAAALAVTVGGYFAVAGGDKATEPKQEPVVSAPADPNKQAPTGPTAERLQRESLELGYAVNKDMVNPAYWQDGDFSPAQIDFLAVRDNVSIILKNITYTIEAPDNVEGMTPPEDALLASIYTDPFDKIQQPDMLNEITAERERVQELQATHPTLPVSERVVDGNSIEVESVVPDKSDTWAEHVYLTADIITTTYDVEDGNIVQHISRDNKKFGIAYNAEIEGWSNGGTDGMYTIPMFISSENIKSTSTVVGQVNR